MLKTIPIKEKIFSQPFVVVGVILEKDGKFLLVQEGRTDVGKWNIPAGWLDLNEDIIEGAKRETKEETGLAVEITGFLGIYASARQRENGINHPVRIIFCAKPLSDKLKLPKGDILDARWFTFEEIKNLGENLRAQVIINEIDDFLAEKIYPLEIIKPFISRI